jgi:hypothetical protein
MKRLLISLINNDDPKIPQLNDEDRFKAEYKDVGDYIWHYSTVRSALTTFLLTAGVATFSAYYHQQQTSPFFVVAGHLFLVVSAYVCLVFSYRTEHANMYQTALWKWSEDISEGYPGGFKRYKPEESVWKHVWFKDPINFALITVILGVLVSFWVVTAANADHFARAVIAVLALFACVAAVAIFHIVSASKQFVWATLATLGLVSLPIIVGYFLLGR